MDYWGNLDCLYNTLQPSDRDTLERAISLHRRGFLAEAEDCILANFPEPQVPVVAIALADIYETRGLERKRAAVLDKASQHLATQTHASSGNEKLLIRILLADALARGGGELGRAVDKIENLQQMFRHFVATNGTEVEASLA